jgi:hypothetical protein
MVQFFLQDVICLSYHSWLDLAAGLFSRKNLARCVGPWRHVSHGIHNETIASRVCKYEAASLRNAWMQEESSKATLFEMHISFCHMTHLGTKNPWTPQLVGVRSSTVGTNACACSSLNFSMARAAGMLPRKIRAKQMSWRMLTCVP